VEVGGGAGGLRVHLPGGARMEIGDAAQARVAAELLRALARLEGKAAVPC
jgi:hypothetical protein